ncbi:MAG: hypothetical protein ACI8PB_001035 [Desulforhopalus sp.]|jgi:hypothetical protein
MDEEVDAVTWLKSHRRFKSMLVIYTSAKKTLVKGQSPLLSIMCCVLESKLIQISYLVQVRGDTISDFSHCL